MNTFLRAPKAAVADLMRLSTPASELREQSMIESKYLLELFREINSAYRHPTGIKNIKAAGLCGRILNPLKVLAMVRGCAADLGSTLGHFTCTLCDHWPLGAS